MKRRYKRLDIVMKGGNYNSEPYSTYFIGTDYANSGWHTNSFRIIKIV